VERSTNNIMENEKQREDWPLSTMCWYAVFIWFGASLFSQSVYIAFYGVPYDANIMLEAAGPFAWLLIGIELVVWVMIAIFVGGKVSNRLQVNQSETTSSDTILPQA
jgi:hypothetical protein